MKSSGSMGGGGPPGAPTRRRRGILPASCPARPPRQSTRERVATRRYKFDDWDLGPRGAGSEGDEDAQASTAPDGAGSEGDEDAQASTAPDGAGSEGDKGRARAGMQRVEEQSTGGPAPPGCKKVTVGSPSYWADRNADAAAVRPMVTNKIFSSVAAVDFTLASGVYLRDSGDILTEEARKAITDAMGEALESLVAGKAVPNGIFLAVMSLFHGRTLLMTEEFFLAAREAYGCDLWLVADVYYVDVQLASEIGEKIRSQEEWGTPPPRWGAPLPYCRWVTRAPAAEGGAPEGVPQGGVRHAPRLYLPGSTDSDIGLGVCAVLFWYVVLGDGPGAMFAQPMSQCAAGPATMCATVGVSIGEQWGKLCSGQLSKTAGVDTLLRAVQRIAGAAPLARGARGSPRFAAELAGLLARAGPKP